MDPNSVSRLQIWRDGMDVVVHAYALTSKWPKQEQYGLTAQVRAAAAAVPTNLAEGVGRGTAPEAARFAQIALGSVYELHTLFQIAARLGFATHAELTQIQQRLSIQARQISAYIRYKRSKATS